MHDLAAIGDAMLGEVGLRPRISALLDVDRSVPGAVFQRDSVAAALTDVQQLPYHAVVEVRRPGQALVEPRVGQYRTLDREGDLAVFLRRADPPADRQPADGAAEDLDLRRSLLGDVERRSGDMPQCELAAVPEPSAADHQGTQPAAVHGQATALRRPLKQFRATTQRVRYRDARGDRVDRAREVLAAVVAQRGPGRRIEPGKPERRHTLLVVRAGRRADD